MDVKALEALLAPIAKEVWESVVHPKLKDLEAKISSADMALVVAALDGAADEIVEGFLKKLEA